jgi:hypothetical protein
MVIDWERVAEMTGKSFLFILEFFSKVSAILIAGVVLAAQGSFGAKLGTGFSSLSVSLRKLFQAPSEISGAATSISQYNSMPADVQSIEAAHGVLVWLNSSVQYIDAVSQNLSSQFFVTVTAAMIAYISVYLVSVVLRFYRQKGEGSWLNKLERDLGQRIFETPAEKMKRLHAEKRKAAVVQSVQMEGKQTEQPQKHESAPRSFRAAQSDNKFLQDYIRLAQNGGG